MVKHFQIYGDIVSESVKQSDSDISLLDFKNFLDGIETGDEIAIEICSCGGDVYQGIAIASLIKQYQQQGYKFNAHVISIAASIASVIACACDNIIMDDNAYIMMHLPYSCNVTGNAIELQKEIEQLNKWKNSLITFYKTKFGLTDEEIEKLLEDETWIDSTNYNDYKLSVNIIPPENHVQLAAKMIDKLNQFNNRDIIERLTSMKNQEIKEDIKEESETQEQPTEMTEQQEVKEEVVEEVKEEVKEVVQEVIEETVEQSKTPEQIIERLNETIRVLEEKISILESEKDKTADERVSGMQSKMQLQINNQKKNFTDKINALNEELNRFKNDYTNLHNEYEKTFIELIEKSSALKEKESALVNLNASVNHASEDMPTYKDGISRCKTPEERIKFIESGKYK